MPQMHRSHVGLLCYPPIIQVFLTSPLSLLARPPRPCNPRDPLVAKGGTAWARIMAGNFCLNVDFHVTFRDLLHAANLRHGTDGFTSPPKEGVLKIFICPLKIWRLRPSLNPRTWVPKASTLPLDHRSRVFYANDFTSCWHTQWILRPCVCHIKNLGG